MKPTIWVDLDETLLWCRSPVEGSVYFRYEDDEEDSYAKLRPSAIEFLEALKDKYDLKVMTQSGLDFKYVVLEKLGIKHYFSDFYGATKVEKTSWGSLDITWKNVEALPEKWLLIDNYSDRDGRLLDKLNMLGVGGLQEGVNFLCGGTYQGEEDEPPLTSLISKIEDIFNA